MKISIKFDASSKDLQIKGYSSSKDLFDEGISEYLISYFQNREAKYLTYQIAFYLICIGFLIPSKNPKLKFL